MQAVANCKLQALSGQDSRAILNNLLPKAITCKNRQPITDSPLLEPCVNNVSDIRMKIAKEFSTIRSNRKTLAIEIRGAQVIVRAPMGCDQEVIAFNCLCPICHRLLHYGSGSEKKYAAEKLFDERHYRLLKCGIDISKRDFLKLII